ncbi:hypothetical protein [Deinococcus sp. JMULE3]|uniref:hypothetical protein n=1 Tax=Deinococcus sp. JMULE3 TaxID=2518341 RepID=UPI00157573D7|nr:hypothetical protein [Deinococcus sp. JMULE3]NTY00545.1 hypothetical protein [Deinococcus sp. JMULE3]
MKKLAPLLLLAPLALGSCGLFNRAPKPVTTAGGTLMDAKVTYDASGNATTTYTAWSGGAGKVTFNMLDNTTQAPVKTGETTLSADGKFSFASLPTPKDSDLTGFENSGTPSECTGKIEISDMAVRGASPLLLTDATADVIVAPMNVTGTTDAAATLFYVDRNAKLSGKETCTYSNPTSTYITEYNVSLVKGWNWVTLKITQDKTTRTFSVTNGIAANLKWAQRIETAQPMSLPTLGRPFTLR